MTLENLQYFAIGGFSALGGAYIGFELLRVRINKAHAKEIAALQAADEAEIDRLSFELTRERHLVGTLLRYLVRIPAPGKSGAWAVGKN